MLSGVKFIPREKIDKVEDENLDDSTKERKKCSSRKEKHRRKGKSSRYSSSDDEGLERIEKRSRKKKWYSSDEYSSSESESEGSSNEDERKWNKKKGKSKHKTKSKRSNGDCSDDEDGDRSKKRSRSREDGRRKSKESRGQKDIAGEDLLDSDRGTDSLKDKEIVRKEMGLEWMLRPGDKRDKRPVMAVDDQTEENPAEEIKKVNPRELNPYLKDDGSGYPEDTDGSKAGGDQLLSSSVVGDGGASWRLKALKRAQEQAAREGRMLEEVVEERWGSVGQLAVSVASRKVAPSRAHLHAIKDRKRGLTGERQTGPENESERDIKKNNGRDYLKDKPLLHPKMREPKVRDFLSWGKRKSQNLSSEDASVISAAVSSLNKFSNDGSFMDEFLQQQSNDPGGSVQGNVESELGSSQANQPSEGSVVIKDGLSANQLAAKAFQLRIKGKHEEANKLLQEAENIKAKQGAGDDSIRPRNEGSASRYIMQDISIRKNKDEDDADMNLAQTITKNKKYAADDEYDFEVGPSKKARKKGERNENKVTHKNIHEKRILTQQERCLFCFENPNGPKHFIVSIANFTYLMVPQWQPVAPGHCCIVPLQHESATRTVDDNVWEEIRNFKKCLIMMFAKQEKDVVFLETVMRLAQQRRHCLIECIPLPREIAKEAPLYFKKAIDEAEDEWSQHNAKKLIDTSEKGLRGSIPKNFPYFHVEFGLNKGFVHVIDDEEQFKSNLGLNVIRGMLRLAEEDMYRRRRYESVDVQKEAVKSFLRDWEPFDWTKQLH